MPKRNLVYHCYPIRGSLWKWNCECMASYLPMFNGRKILSIAQDNTTVDPKEVLAILKGFVVRKGPNQPPDRKSVV